MFRVLPILIGLTVLFAGGLVHGRWTDRWVQSEELSTAVERIEALPDDLGPWKGTPYPQDEKALAMAGAAGHYSRSFTDPVTGEQVLVILLVGRASRMVVHRPEHCYQSDGYLLRDAPLPIEVQPAGEPVSHFLTGLFRREEEAGPNQLRIFWAFGTDEGWEAPGSPRLQYARRRTLYKLHLVRLANNVSPALREDPCVRLLGQLLPVLHRTLFTN